jgi:hypothetical protein
MSTAVRDLIIRHTLALVDHSSRRVICGHGLPRQARWGLPRRA